MASVGSGWLLWSVYYSCRLRRPIIQFACGRVYCIFVDECIASLEWTNTNPWFEFFPLIVSSLVFNVVLLSMCCFRVGWPHFSTWWRLQELYGFLCFLLSLLLTSTTGFGIILYAGLLRNVGLDARTVSLDWCYIHPWCEEAVLFATLLVITICMLSLWRTTR